MTKSRDPNSKRSLKRSNRNFTNSRPVRRALKRLNSAKGAYNPNEPSSNQPGSMKYW